MNLYEATYYHNGELDSFLFVSDGTRKPMLEEAADAYRKMTELDGSDPVEIEEVYKLGSVQDFTTGKNYKITLRKM